MKKDYIKWIRSKVNHEPIILNASVSIIENDFGNILVLRRGDREEEVWGLPGGMMEIGESAEDTMRREVQEEINLNVEIKYFQGVYSNRGIERYPNGDMAQVTLFVFVCKSKDKNSIAIPDGVEAIDTKYIPLKTAKNIMGHHKILLEDFANRLSGLVR